jgi:flagellar biosynthetic protein FliR
VITVLSFFTVAPVHVQLALLALTRLTGMMLMTPPFNHASVPVQVKIGVAFSLVLLVWNPLAAHPPALSPDVLTLTGLAASELVVGLSIGFMARLILVAASFAAEMVGVQAGFSLASVIDPMSTSHVTVLTGLYDWTMLALFLALDVHHIVIEAVVRSFVIVPPGTPVLSAAAVAGIVPLAGHIFTVGLALVAPILGVLLLTHLVLVLCARAVPQINLMAVGFPITVLVGLVGLLVNLDLMSGIVGRELQGFRGAVGALVQGFAHGR